MVDGFHSKSANFGRYAVLRHPIIDPILALACTVEMLSSCLHQYISQ